MKKYLRLLPLTLLSMGLFSCNNLAMTSDADNSNSSNFIDSNSVTTIEEAVTTIEEAVESSNEISVEIDSEDVTTDESSEDITTSEIVELTSDVEISSESGIAYTAAEAIDAVANLMSIAFGETIPAYHDTEGDYVFINFGSISHATIEAYCDAYFVPEGFEMVNNWAEDIFQDGTPVEYADYVCGNIGLEYLVYDVDGYEGDYEIYNGTYLQIEAFELI